MLVALCALSALFAMVLMVLFAVGESPLPLLKIASCVLLIDQSVVTILYILAKRLPGSFRILVLVGSVGIAIGGFLLVVQNATRPDREPQILVSVLGAVAILQGAITLWQFARNSSPEATK
jgi:hypothetical protein